MNARQVLERFLEESGIVNGFEIDENAVREMVNVFYEVYSDLAPDEVESADAATIVAVAAWNHCIVSDVSCPNPTDIREAVEKYAPRELLDLVEKYMSERGWA